MPKQNDEFRTLRDSFELFGKILIASRQFESELSEYLHKLLPSLNEDFRKAGIELAGSPRQWWGEDKSESERYAGFRIFITKFNKIPQNDEDDKAQLYIGLAYSFRIEKEEDVYPYVIMSLEYPVASKKKWQSHFMDIRKRVDKKYKLKAFADYLDFYPADYEKNRHKNLDEISHELEAMVNNFLEAQ